MPPAPDTLSGYIERVTYHNAENGFSVLRVKVKGRQELVSVVGQTTSVSAGEQVEATGRWTIDPQHGQQFKADVLQTTHPASAKGIEKYLASGAIRSVGPKLAARIVAVHQEQTLQMLEDAPDALLHIRGIGAGRLSRIRQSWREQKEVRKITLFLTEHGITAGRAVRIFRTYGHQSIAIIKHNPYQLATDIRGIGFKTADELGSQLGIDRNSPYRAQAAVRYTLQHLASQGHCGFPELGVVQQATKLVDIKESIIAAAVDSTVLAGGVIREEVNHEQWLYLEALYRAEVGFAAAVRQITTASKHPLPDVDIERAIAWVETRLSIELAVAQKQAIYEACQQKLLVITGGPGVGKTTVVRSILEVFSAKQMHCVLAAPTGRAAKRLAEVSGQSAATIHRLLEFDPATGDFKRNADFPLAGDLFIFDETSMIDIVLGYQLLRAIPAGSAVVLVGDVDQLPSVGPGAVLQDLIGSGTVPVVRLTNIFRQARESRITVAANAINQGELPELSYSQDLTDFYFVESADPESIQEMIVRLVKKRIPSRFHIDPRSDIQVLAPMQRSLLGARNLNLVLQEALNPDDGGPAVERFGWAYRIGDRVIQTENNYDRDVFNGDLGIVERINRIEQRLTVRFDAREVDYDFGDLDELALAYVLSIHKSQGSEFPCVVVPLHTQHYMMLQRNLLYTAVTRAKQLAVLVGTKKALRMAIDRIDTRERYSALQSRLEDRS